MHYQNFKLATDDTMMYEPQQTPARQTHCGSRVKIAGAALTEPYYQASYIRNLAKLPRHVIFSERTRLQRVRTSSTYCDINNCRLVSLGRKGGQPAT